MMPREAHRDPIKSPIEASKTGDVSVSQRAKQVSTTGQRQKVVAGGPRCYATPAFACCPGACGGQQPVVLRGTTALARSRLKSVPGARKGMLAGHDHVDRHRSTS